MMRTSYRFCDEEKVGSDNGMETGTIQTKCYHKLIPPVGCSPHTLCNPPPSKPLLQLELPLAAVPFSRTLSMASVQDLLTTTCLIVLLESIPEFIESWIP